MNTKERNKVGQGDLLLVSYPYSDLSQTKRRPILVISNNLKTGEDFICLPITTNLLGSNLQLLSNEGLENGTIPRESGIKVDNIFILEEGVEKLSL